MNPRHVTAAFAITYIAYCTDGYLTLSVNLIRTWTTRGHVRRVGTDPDGFALYDLDSLVGYIESRGLLVSELQT